MKKSLSNIFRTLACFALLFNGLSSHAQIPTCATGPCGINLATNPSFEATTNFCQTPTSGLGGQLFLNYSPVQNWIGVSSSTGRQSGSTPDYYNSTCPGINSTSNCGGGIGSLGVYTKTPGGNNTNGREYVQAQLLQPLKAGHEYCVSIKV